MPSFPSAFRFCPFCGGSLGPPRGVDVAQMCQACRALLYHSAKPGVGVVLARPDDDAVLLIRRRWPPYRGKRGVPGGFVGYGETPQAAAIREVREETGLEIHPRHLIGTWMNFYRRPQGIDRVLLLYFTADIVGGQEQAGDEATAVAWFERDALPRRLAGQDLAVIRAARAVPNASSTPYVLTGVRHVPANCRYLD